VSAGRRSLDPRAAAALAGQLRYQARECERLGSPLYAGLLTRSAADAEAGGAAWALLSGHEDDPPGSVLGLRLMGAVHRLVLEGSLPDLARACALPEPDPSAAWPAFGRALAERADALRPLIERTVQTNEVGRCAALLPGFLAVSERTGLPLRLLEVGASAGLHLRWDRYRYEAGDFAWGPADSPLRIGFQLSGAPPSPAPVAVAARRGCDRSPLDPAREDGRLTLLSYIWADQPRRAARVRAATAIAAEVPARLDQADAVGWVRERLAEPAPDLASVVFHSIVVQYLEEAEREALAEAVRAAGSRASATAPLAWLRMEPAGGHADVRLTLWPPGEELHLARAGFHGDPVELLAM
jgi:hypothetical protein